MGQAAEDLADLEYKQSMPRSEVNPHGYEVIPLWTMRDGSTILITEMEVSHINNCINMLQRALDSIPDPYYGGEPEGDHAHDAFMRGVREIERRENNIRHNITIFKKELAKREQQTTTR